MGDLLFRADCWLGERVSEAVCGHHRRRLGRLGWSGAVDPPAGGWAAGSPVPRAGNAVEVLIDGAEALPRIAAELERARSHVHIAGWYFSPDFALAREGAPSVVRNLLARPCRARRGESARVGRGTAAAVPSVSEGGAGDAGSADRGDEDPVRPRRA